MRSITVITFACLAALVSCSYMNKGVKYADHDFLVKQKFVFDIFQHIHQDEIFVKFYEIVKDYNIKDHYDHFEKVDLVKEFVSYYEHDPLPEHELFSIMFDEHEKYAMSLFHVFMYAKDYETFYNTVLWARFHVNKGVFIYAFTVACLHRTDMEGIVMPAIYEIYPFYFFDTETIQMAQLYKMQGFHDMKKVEGVYTAVIPSNYTGVWGHMNEDNLMAYYMEDVGLNSFYYYYNMDYPFWYAGEEDKKLIKDRRGEFYFYVHQQLLARATMERFSNSLPEFDEFSFNTVMDVGYYPGLRYYNGIHFPDRENHHDMYRRENFYDIDMIELYEHRIMNAIDHGFFYKPDNEHFKFTDFHVGLELLGNVVQGTVDSVNKKFYGNIDFMFRNIISHAVTHGEHELTVPGILHHYETSMRDPAFYEMYKRILRYYDHFLDTFEHYTTEELTFDGVHIEGVEMDKLVTYYDKFDSDITNVVDMDTYEEHTESDLMTFGRVSNYKGHDFYIKARQFRLNHLPFTFKLNVKSDKAQKAAVKVFIGPKYDYYGHKFDLNENRKNFFELEHFIVDLTEGKNVITRSSDDYSWYVHDRTTYFELYKQIMLATNTEDHKFPLDMSEAHCGFPQRLMLPKGKKGGMPFQFFFMVMPFHEDVVSQFTGFDPVVSCGVGSGARYPDTLPFGYPFDRDLDEKTFFHDNMFFYDTMIYFKTEADVNAVH